MGIVYRAEHIDLRVPFALKVLAPDLARNRLAEERFFREAVAASHVRHPHVVRVSDYGRDLGITYFVMDYLIGEDLGAVLSRTALTVPQIASLMLPICSAIAETHERGFIHRDLKPSNIFLAQNALTRVVPTLLDFGVAKATDLAPSAALTQDGAIVGTPHYLAPEQLRRLPATARSDQYAVGVILYQCATGRLPFEGPTATVMKAIAARNFTHPRDRRPDLPLDFANLILKTMSERPGDRFDSLRALGRALLAFAPAKQIAEWTDHFSQQRPIGSLSVAIEVDASRDWIKPPEGRCTLDEATPITTNYGQPSARRRLALVGGAGLVIALGFGSWAFWPSRGSADRPVAVAPPAEPAAAPLTPLGTPAALVQRNDPGPTAPVQVQPPDETRKNKGRTRASRHRNGFAPSPDTSAQGSLGAPDELLSDAPPPKGGTRPAGWSYPTVPPAPPPTTYRLTTEQ